MKRRRLAGAPRGLAWALAASVAGAACGGVQADLRARPAPASTAFERVELIDVLAPGTVSAIDRPAFDSQETAAERIGAQDPVVVVALRGEARAYPIAILVWHEVVNDRLGGEPIAVTYAPLAGAAVAFRRRVAGRVATFASSGKLYRSDLVLYDRATRSLWPQLSGRAVAGPLAGARLERIPAQVTSFAEFRAAHPGGAVLAAVPGGARIYGVNPYPGYDSRRAPSTAFFPRRLDARLPAMERVIGVRVAGEARAYPFGHLREAGVVHDRVGGHEVVVLWRPGTRSALDAALISDGREVGSAGAFAAATGGRRLRLVPGADGFRDLETGSTWSVLGVATAGPLRGRWLDPVDAVEAFWFAWAAFEPATTVRGSP